MGMGRGRRAGRTEFCHVVRDVLCARGHKVGMVWKYIPPDPRAGYHASKMAFTDTPSGGKLERQCPECGDVVRVRWQRLADALDDGERDGQHTGVFETFSP